LPEGPEPCKATRGKTAEGFLCTICSIRLNQSITVEVLSAESGVLEATVLSRDLPRQIVLRSAIDNGVIAINRPGSGGGCVFLLVLSAALIAAALYWFYGSR